MNNINAMRRNTNIYNAIVEEYYNNLGRVNYIDCDINKFEISVIPNEGIHRNTSYNLIFKFIDNEFPKLFVNSPIFDRIKTNQYINNRGRNGEHNGICIKPLSYSYGFTKNFQKYCGNKWKNYIYNIISTFNNIQDFEKGNGFKSNYKTILNI